MTHLDDDLIGKPGSAAKIATPALVLDRAAMRANIAAMAAFAKAKGIALRPHAKTHKSAEIAREQIAAGALGVCVAKLGEAEALSASGIENILVTSPIVSARAIARLVGLAGRAKGLMAVVDSQGGAAALGAAMREAGLRLDILVDINVGLGRTGASLESAAAIARSLANDPALRLRGFQAYAGHLMHIADRAERRAKSHAALKPVGALAKELRAEGLAIDIVSGGGTGTFDIDPDAGVFTELQVGSYVFMDREYCDVFEGERLPFARALFVQTTIISTNVKGLATTDAGIKSFAADAGPPTIANGAPEGAKYFLFGDEQGGVVLPEGEALAAGDVLRCVVPHCDPTVNLYDTYHVIDGETLAALWPVTARGRSQ
ncbi:MAG: DSD1 family PLP-dependent enzyme [Alphaproteobacteria bacterium]|nr:DSD1 family PLP-dependent enzyme [Alphaproteobacteria bacterium]